MNKKIILKDTPKLRQQIIETCLILEKIGYIVGTWGNISVRIKQGLLITPTRLDYDIMKPADLAIVSMDGEKLKGDKIFSSETELHRQIYLNRDDVDAVVHIHPPYGSSVAAMRKTLPVVLEDMAQIIGDKVCCSKYVPGGKHIEFAKSAIKALGKKSMAALLANHGVVICGYNLKEALVASQVLEKAAMCYMNAIATGKCFTIPEKCVKDERYRYLYKYGKPDDFVQQK